jgi:hypothetical protein
MLRVAGNAAKYGRCNMSDFRELQALKEGENESPIAICSLLP